MRRTLEASEAIRADMLDYYHRRGLPVPEDLRQLLSLTERENLA